MMTISKNISGKIEESILEAIELIDTVAKQDGINYFIVGAKARDLFFSAIYNIDTRRATLDIDIGTNVNNWERATKLVEALLETTQFERVGNLQFRIRHTNNVIVDVIPFGEIENPKGTIRWPGDDREMTTTGFEEAFESSITIRLRDEPSLDVRVCTPPGIVILKLIAWDEKYPDRSDDAIDIKYILETYIEAGNDNRLYGEDGDLHSEEDFDYTNASARILGRDIAKIASRETINYILEILDRETDENSDYRLITDMNRDKGSFRGEYFKYSLNLVYQLKKGILERI